MGADFGSRNPINTEEDEGEVQTRDGDINRASSNLPAEPITEEEQEKSILIEQKIMGDAMSCVAGISMDPDRIYALTMERIREESGLYGTIKSMVELVTQGYPETRAEWPDELQEFYPYRESLSTTGEILLFKNRIVMPTSLRKVALDILHSGHQGVTTMVAIASQSVFWHGINEEIKSRRAACISCNRVAPSQAAAPPWPLPKPSYPFEMIATDYFSFAGKSYYVIVDRYSGWISIYKAGNEGARELIRTLKEYFATFGIASEVTSDGGPQFVSSQVR